MFRIEFLGEAVVYDKSKENCGEVTTVFLNELNLTGDLKNDLQTIINKHIKQITQTDWRYCLITYPELFECMSPFYYRIRSSADYKRSNVLLAKKCSSNGFNCEIFTTALKYELKKRGIKTLFADGIEVGKTTYGVYSLIYDHIEKNM